ncbi:hypothetical protein RchiOBHm_Chr2g0175791 [Rosa chinensis]|uniref:Transmembrane protein n=2 Tax=Rosa chinensis TaxID=74649 RepID=A0A2P6S6G8_ROSCH|nr:hypothetical protein RchiOBHm_Chr2g0175791 [Rosa chinensis]
MSDWGPVFIAVVLFILLTPGLLIQIPGKSRFVEFGNFQTSGVSILKSRFEPCCRRLSFCLQFYILLFQNQISSTFSEPSIELSISMKAVEDLSVLWFLGLLCLVRTLGRLICTVVCLGFLCLVEHLSSQSIEAAGRRGLEMSDWGPVFIAVVLFILLTPGLLIQIPGKSRFVEFGNFQTSGVSILVHSIIYFTLICIFLLAIGVHMYVGS